MLQTFSPGRGSREHTGPTVNEILEHDCSRLLLSPSHAAFPTARRWQGTSIPSSTFPEQKVCTSWLLSNRSWLCPSVRGRQTDGLDRHPPWLSRTRIPPWLLLALLSPAPLLEAGLPSCRCSPFLACARARLRLAAGMAAAGIAPSGTDGDILPCSRMGGGLREEGIVCR